MGSLLGQGIYEVLRTLIPKAISIPAMDYSSPMAPNHGLPDLVPEEAARDVFAYALKANLAKKVQIPYHQGLGSRDLQ